NWVSLRPSSCLICTPMMEKSVHTAKQMVKAKVLPHSAICCWPGVTERGTSMVELLQGKPGRRGKSALAPPPPCSWCHYNAAGRCAALRWVKRGRDDSDRPGSIDRLRLQPAHAVAFGEDLQVLVDRVLPHLGLEVGGDARLRFFITYRFTALDGV